MVSFVISEYRSDLILNKNKENNPENNKERELDCEK